MKFFLLVIAATCGISAALPLENLIPTMIEKAGNISQMGINVGINAAEAGIGVGEWGSGMGWDVMKNATSGGLNIGKNAVVQSISVGQEAAKQGMALASDVVSGVGSKLNEVPVVGGMMSQGAEAAASIIKNVSSGIEGGLEKLKEFEKKKFDLINQAASWGIGKGANMTAASLAMGKGAVSAGGQTAASVVDKMTSAGSGATGSFIKFWG